MPVPCQTVRWLSPELQERLVSDGRAGLSAVLARLLGHRLPGGYELVDVLGVGGQGIVCAATDAAQRKVAVKLPLLDYHRPWAYGEQEILRAGAMIDQEARVLSDICQGLDLLPAYIDLVRAPCPLHEPARSALEVGPAPFLVMEHVDGQPLMAHVRKGLLEADVSRERLLRQAALEVLQLQLALETRGAVYVDLKPDHLVVQPEFGIRLLDAGSIHLPGEASSIPMAITRGYGWGEVSLPGGANPVHHVARRSLARTLLEVWTGRRPSTGHSSLASSGRPEAAPKWLIMLVEALESTEPVSWGKLLERVV